MKLRTPLLISLVLLTGCDLIDRGISSLMGPETSTVNLTNGPTTIRPPGLTLRSDERMKVLGDDAAVCLVVAHNDDLASMEKEIQESFRGASVTATLKMKSGSTFTYSDIEPTWNKWGRLNADESEISACVTCACGPKPKPGDEVTEISLVPSSEIRVLGIYWESSKPLGGT
jgi:hypothetical protein